MNITAMKVETAAAKAMAETRVSDGILGNSFGECAQNIATRNG
jgi:hypothetical protein